MSAKAEDAELVEFTYKGRTRKGYPEVAAYLNNMRDGHRQYEDLRAEADYEFRKAERALFRSEEDAGRRWDTYSNRDQQRAHRVLTDARQAKYDQANAALRSDRLRDALRQSSHKEVAFIARKCLFAGQGDEVEGYARDILAILPATTAEIWKEAKDNRGMCEVFDRFYDDADAEGVFSDGGAVPARREIAAMRNYLRRNYGSSYVTDFMERLNPILKAYEEFYDKRFADAKAEWEGLDEAWRSERSRRGAATRAERAREAVDTTAEGPAAAEVPDYATITAQSVQVGVNELRSSYANGRIDFASVAETEEKVNS